MGVVASDVDDDGWADVYVSQYGARGLSAISARGDSRR
jgi:hypothetical protein